MKAHDCRFDWCENLSTGSEAQRLEHFHTPTYIPVTGDSLAGIGYSDRHPDREDMPTIGVLVRFNEDVEPSPCICLVLEGGQHARPAEAVLKIDEAVLLYNALGHAIVNACKGTNLSPKRITAFYSSRGE